MLLRSASTPLLGSLLPSSSSHLFTGESPVSIHNTHVNQFPTSCHLSSPALSDTSNHSNTSFIRRTLSDSNLLAFMADNPDEFPYATPSRRATPALEPIPSLSVRDCVFDESEETEEQGIDPDMAFLDEDRIVGAKVPPLFLARGLGIDRISSGMLNAGGDSDGGDGNGNGNGGGRGGCKLLTDNGGNQLELELYYKRMVEQHPTDPLLLRNYALFLYQVKQDYQKAEYYYSRAILADPNDGETLSKYASLIWEMHRDEERASSYYEQSVQASPENSYVLAAQAGFLWDIDEGDVTEEENSGIYNFSGYASHVGEMVSTAS